jgi:tripartite-type tricarboxylate transporter receptor subunit TctC
MVAPAKVPKEIIAKVHREISALLTSAQFREVLTARGIIPLGGTSEEFGEFMRREVKKYAAAAKDIRAE